MAVWHRRAGKDLFAINLIAAASVQRVGLYWHLLPTYNQGRKIVWDGFTKDGRKFLDHFPKEIIASKNNTEMRLTLKTGSIYQVVGTEDPDRLVGTNPVGVVFSEFSLQNPKAWDLIRPILAENEGWALFIYTARGRNHGYRMIQMAQKNPKWKGEILIAGNKGTKRPDGTPVISDEVIQDERDSGMPEETIQQEFYCSFEAPVIGAYYGSQMLKADKDNRVTRVPFDPTLKVNTSWDLGMADATAIWFWQEYGFELRICKYYETSGEPLSHYARILHQVATNNNFTYGRHYAPHDIKVREMATGKSRYEVARSLGIKFTIVPKHDVMDGIEATRNMISSCWFDEEECGPGLDCLRQYRKEWDEQNKCYKDRPLHDWTSHGADSFRIMAWGRKRRKKNKGKPQQTAGMDYDPLAA